MTFIYCFAIFVLIMFVYLVYRTIKLSTMESPNLPNFPVEEEEHHLFSERPHNTQKEVIELEMVETQKVAQKDRVILHMMKFGTISKGDAQDLEVKRLPMHIFRLRQEYKIDNVIVNGKFSHYKLIGLKSN